MNATLINPLYFSVNLSQPVPLAISVNETVTMSYIFIMNCIDGDCVHNYIL